MIETRGQWLVLKALPNEPLAGFAERVTGPDVVGTIEVLRETARELKGIRNSINTARPESIGTLDSHRSVRFSTWQRERINRIVDNLADWLTEKSE